MTKRNHPKLFTLLFVISVILSGCGSNPPKNESSINEQTSSSLEETEKLISIEDHSVIGGLGSAISEVLTEEYPVRLDRMGIKDTFGKSGKAEELMEYFEITAKDIVKKFWIDVRHVHQESL